MAVLFTGKLIGGTAAFAAGTATGILTQVAVTLDSDNMVRWTDANGRAQAVPVHGPLATLFKQVLTGAGAPTHRFHE